MFVKRQLRQSGLCGCLVNEEWCGVQWDFSRSWLWRGRSEVTVIKRACEQRQALRTKDKPTSAATSMALGDASSGDLRRKSDIFTRKSSKMGQVL